MTSAYLIDAGEQLTIRRFLKDSDYRKWFSRRPAPRGIQLMDRKPWRLFVQEAEGGKWKRGDVRSYDAAYEHARRLLLEGVYDLTIHSRGLAYYPPTRFGKVWDKYPPSHEWCPYCRRPTVFGWFSRHHALPALTDLSQDQRCAICGVRGSDPFTRKFQVKGAYF